MFRAAIIVGIGGFLGSVLRFISTTFFQKVFGTTFPLGTLIVNLVGSLLIGFLLGLFERGSLISPDLRIFLTVGFCGGFTTFSTFTNDTVNLVNDNELLYLMLYMGLSIFAGISFTFIGKNLVSLIWGN
jgi:CrcB protein